MKKFNKLVKAGTKVQIAGEYGYRTVLSVSPSQRLIAVKGICGSFQVGHVTAFSNKKTGIDMYPAIDDRA